MKKTAILLIITAMLSLAVPSPAVESVFRREFMQAREANRFEALVALVKANRDRIPAEVKALIKEALEGDKSFNERMQMLDTANAMAAMMKYWHEDEKPLAEVEAVQRRLIKAENERLVDVEKLVRYERYPGNVIMSANEAKMSAKGLPPVVFSHWSHRLFYECRACHDRLFKPERGGNGVTNAAILEGRLCGACHNNTLAFGADGNCERCHSASKTSETGPMEPAKTDMSAIKESGDRLGAPWEPEKLVNRTLPLDRLGLIDWMELRKSGAYAPMKSHDGGAVKYDARNTVIIFTPRIPGINRVSFSHASHTKEINCATCHPSPFKDALGANESSMAAMADGRGCGYCHGRVAFKFADCKRCHSVKPDETPAGVNVLTR